MDMPSIDSAVLEALSQDVQTLLTALDNNTMILQMFRTGMDCHLILEDSTAYRHTLILKNVENDPLLVIPECTIIRDFSLSHDGEKYHLRFYPQESSEAISLSCSGFDAELEHFNAMGGLVHWQTPWEHLVSTAAVLAPKVKLYGAHCNTQEQELLPLLNELLYLPPYCGSPAPGEAAAFPVLKDIALRTGSKSILKRLEKLEKQAVPGKRFRSLAEKLVEKLNGTRYETIWREIYGKLQESQAEYPSKAEALCPQELLEATRSEIWQRMEQYGYLGSYPNFSRKRFLPGIHLEESYGVCYWAGMKRNTRFRIHCFETVENGNLCIRFVTGTALLRRKEKARDVFACLFNGKGRFSHSVAYNLPLDPAKREDMPKNSLAQHVKASVKKAALRPLSRKEKKAIGQTPKAGFGTFMKTFLLEGGLFALTLVGTVMLAALVAMYFVDGMDAAKALLLQFPWWIFLAAAWLLYGLFSASVTVAAKNK